MTDRATGGGIRAGVRRLFRLPLHTPTIARADADAELESFLEERIASLVQRGMTPAEARQEALRRLGAPLGEVRAALRQSAERREGRQRPREMIDELLQDLRFAGRQFLRAPAFTAIAVLILALGIGANTAIFSVIDRLLLDPLPYPNGDRIVMPMRENELLRGDARAERQSVNAALIEAWQERTHTVDAISAAAVAMFAVRPDGIVDTIPSAPVTANFFSMLGVQPILGRGFVQEDEQPADQVAVAMISYALWQRAYDGRADVLGRTVSLDGRPLTIVGVTPPGLNIPLSQNPAPDIWVPEPFRHAVNGGNGILKPGPTVFAVLRPGVSVEAASRELQTIAASVPDRVQSRHASVRVMRAQDFLDARQTRALQVLFAAVGALLLIACANVANLLLARAWTRQREFAVRSALGAGRRRLVRQLLTESIAIAIAGGLLGVGVAWLALRVIVALRPPALEQLADVRLEPNLLLWTLGVSIATGILFGCAPAVVAGARRVGDVLRRETRGGSAGIASRRVRSALIVLEIAMSLVLLVSSGLLVRSFVELQRMPLGFEPRGLLYTDVLIGGPRNRGRAVVVREQIIAKLRTLPEVTGVAIGTMPGKGYIAPGLVAETGGAGHTTEVPAYGTVFISADYFSVARIALIAGRLPDSSMLTWARTAPRFTLSPEVVVNRALARRISPDGRALGARVREARQPPGRPAAPWSTVVGVVDDTRMPDVRGDIAALQLYSVIPPQLGDVPFVVRTAMSGDVTAPAVKHAIASVDPGLFVRPLLSGDTYLRDGLAPTRFAMALLTAFAAIALVLAAVGLYGVIAYSVAQRTREIGVRVALGAQAADVARLVLVEAVRLAAAGVVLGVAGALAATGALRGLLFGVGPGDPATFIVIALLLAAVALLSAYLPTRRALGVDPTEALRAE
jgi:predicted permease